MQKFSKTLKVALISSLISFYPSFGSGLDLIFNIVSSEKRLQKRVPQEDIAIALESAKRMNEIILEAIYQTGVANDKKISPADVREINKYIVKNYYDEWVQLHGDDEKGYETGYHLIQKDGARKKLFGKNAINKVFDSIYHLGYPLYSNRWLANEDGNKNTPVIRVAIWLDKLLKKDMENGSLFNPAVQEVVGETGTGLDKIIDIIYKDKRLHKNVSTGDLREAARCANEMNKILMEAVYAINALEDGKISKDEILRINQYIVENYQDRWAELHGYDGKNGEETGFHRVVHNGGNLKIFRKKAINTVFNGIYHIGFPTPYSNHLANRDGKRSLSFKRAADWLTRLLNQ